MKKKLDNKNKKTKIKYMLFTLNTNNLNSTSITINSNGNSSNITSNSTTINNIFNPNDYFSNNYSKFLVQKFILIENKTFNNDTNQDELMYVLDINPDYIPKEENELHSLLLNDYNSNSLQNLNYNYLNNTTITYPLDLYTQYNITTTTNTIGNLQLHKIKNDLTSQMNSYFNTNNKNP